MKARILFLLIACTAMLQAADPTPAGSTAELKAIKGSIQLPSGWFLREEGEDGLTVYQITREKVESENDPFTAGLIISVTTKVPDRNSMKPSEYAAELLSSTQDEGGGELKKTTEGDFIVYRAEYKIEADSGNVEVINLAKANDKTGTLYFLTWQAPQAEEAKMGPLREEIFKSLKLDQTY